MQARFSQRYGHSPVSQAVQLKQVDNALRNSLWNALDICFWEPLYTPGIGGLGIHTNRRLYQVCMSIWANYFKNTLDSISDNWSITKAELKGYFLNCKWYEVYDFLEFMVPLDSDHPSSPGQFAALVNVYLEREVSAYRLVEGLVVPVTNQQEISEIEIAMAGQLDSVSNQLRTALEFLSDRQNPDYRNSVKESISAVEGQVRASLGTENGTLGDLLKKFDQRAPIHPAFKAAFITLYGYTSDESGIRHALIEGGREVTFEEAKFMLVACSAFINYVRGISVA